MGAVLQVAEDVAVKVESELTNMKVGRACMPCLQPAPVRECLAAPPAVVLSCLDAPCTPLYALPLFHALDVCTSPASPASDTSGNMCGTLNAIFLTAAAHCKMRVMRALQIRATQLEGGVRSRDREIKELSELLRQTKSLEYDAYMKQSKTEEGGWGSRPAAWWQSGGWWWWWGGGLGPPLTWLIAPPFPRAPPSDLGSHMASAAPMHPPGAWAAAPGHHARCLSCTLLAQAPSAWKRTSRSRACASCSWRRSSRRATRRRRRWGGRWSRSGQRRTR